MKKHLLLLSLICLTFGCSSETGPLNLPIPFSGALTPNTNIAAVEGAPLSGGESFPIIWNANWQTADGMTGGTFTFHSLSGLNVIPVTGGNNREYILDYSATVGSDLEVRVNEASCFEFPLSNTPSDELADFAATIGGTPQVKKVICSGNIDSCQGDCTIGELVDFKSVMGVVELPDGTVQFHTQDESALYVQGSSFLLAGGDTESNVVVTIIADGFIADLPLDALPGGPDVIRSFSIPLFFPGSDEQVGSEIIHTHNITLLPNGALDLELTVDFIIGSSFVRMRNVHDIVNPLPAANDPLDLLIESMFSDDPNFSDTVLTENGGVAFFPTVTETDPVNCDPAANEATGIFRERCCEGGGTCTADFRCLIKFNPLEPVPPAFFSQGAWFFSRP